MRVALLFLLCAARAWAIDDCFAGDKPVNLNNGASTENYTGLVRCFDRDTKEETRSMTYSRGKLNGREKRKWPGGMAIEQEYRDDKRHGELRKYEDGKLIEVSHYVDDRELGEALFYSKSGKLIRKVDRREPDGASTWQEFDEAGRLLEAGCGRQVTWPAGLKDCKWSGPSPLIFFHPNGQKREVIELRDGLRHGLTTTFNREGVKDGEERYSQGKRDGLFVDFENGKPRRSANYVAGEKEGEEIEYFPDGRKKKVNVWKAREAVKATEYFQNGEKMFEGVRDGATSVESRFNDLGQLEVRTHYRRRKLEGLRELFLPDGGLRLRESYVDGELQGRLQSWFDDGKPAEDSQWEKGHVTKRKRWEPDGGLVEDEEFYEDGSRKRKR